MGNFAGCQLCETCEKTMINAGVLGLLFEETIRFKAGLNFGQALEVMKDFGKVRLPFWNKNTFVYIEQLDDYTHPYFVVESDRGTVPWIPTYVEMLSGEWEVVKNDESTN